MEHCAFNQNSTKYPYLATNNILNEVNYIIFKITLERFIVDLNSLFKIRNSESFIL